MASRQVRGALPRAAVAVALAASPVVAAAAGSTPAAAAAPPPEAPVTLFSEDFEHEVGAAPTILTDYVGASSTYAAHPAWVRACNGVVVSFVAPAAGQADAGCGEPGTSSTAYAGVRMMAHALAELAGSAPATNHALAAYTEGEDPGTDRVELETAGPVALQAGPQSRFLSVALDTAAMNCEAGAAVYQVVLDDADGAASLAGAPIDTCAGGTLVSVPAPAGSEAGPAVVRVAHRSTAPAVLLDGAAVGLQVRNLNGSGSGNDAALDNLRLLDVSPRLSTAFAPATVAPGQPATLTFTVTNTSELGAKAGFGFVDRLPAGLRVAPDPRSRTTCPGAVVTGAVAGSGSVGATGSLAAGQRSCTMSI